MASGTISNRPQADSTPSQQRYEDFIQKRLEQTRRQVRLVDVAYNTMLLAVASLLFFLAVALLDHWVFQHGLNFLGRLALFALWVGGATAFVWRFLLPPLANRINPVFAAQTIEQGRPSLKNSLINFLLLRSHPQDVAPVVYRAMEHRAAADLLKVPVDHAVDRGGIVQLGCVLAGVVAVFALYLALSPKNPLVSAARVLWPWSSLPAPTRVQIDEVSPGNKVVYNDDREPISAHVTGLRDGEEAILVVSTADGQVVDDRIAMTRTDDADHYRCELPQGSGGFQQDTLYRIAAGDATTPQYKLDVQIAPTISVDSIDYHFPSYTKLGDRTIKGLGDIKGPEGTQVTIHATANMEIHEPRIDLDCRGLQTLSMTASGTQATGQFTLALDRDGEGRIKPRYEQYQILFTDANGRSVHRPVRYRIVVDPDLPPEITIVAPSQEELQVPEDGKLPIRVRALDDYALRNVTLHAQGVGLLGREGEDLNLPRPVLLDRLKPEEFTGTFENKTPYLFQPAELELKAGDVVRLWATAEDNKEPSPNRSKTTLRTIHIVASGQGGQPDPQNQPPGANGQPQTNGAKSEQSGPGNKNGSGKGGSSNKEEGAKDGDHGPGDKPNQDRPGANSLDPKSGERPSSENAKGQARDKPDPEDTENQPQKVDPTTQAADAIKQINKDREQQEKQRQKNSAGTNNADQQQGPNPQQSPSHPGDQPQSNPQPGSQGNNGGQSGESRQSPNNTGDNKNQGGPGSQPSGGGSQPQPGSQDASQSASSQPQRSQQNADHQGDPKSSPQGNPGGSDNSASQSQANKDTAKPSGNDTAGGQSSPNSAGGSSEPKSPNGTQGQSSGSHAKADSNNAASKQGQPDPSAGGGKQDPANGKSGTQADKNQSANNGIPQGSQPKQVGESGTKGQSAGGDSKTAKPQPGGEQAKSDSASGGNTKPDSQTAKPGGKGPGDNELAKNTPRPEPTKSPGSSGSDSQGSAAEKMENKPKNDGSNPSGGGPGTQPKQDEKKPGDGGDSSGGGDKSKPGQGNSDGSSGGMQPKGRPGSDQGGPGDNGSPQQDAGRNGDPAPQEGSSAPGSQPGNRNPGSAAQGANSPSDNPQPPGTTPPDRKSNTAAAPKSGGGAGGGKPDNKTSTGTAGTESAAAKGGAVSNQHGSDATGTKGGNDVASRQPTGSSQKQQGEGNGETHKASDNQTANDNSHQPHGASQSTTQSQTQNGSNNAQPGTHPSQQPGQQASGLPAGGGPAKNLNETAATPPPESGPDAPNLTFTKKQVDLALEHLKNQKDKPKSELLNRLGWTKEEAQKFLDNMQKLKDSAQRPGSQGDAGKKAYDEFLKNLDLHPKSTELRGGSTTTDNLQNVHDSGQTEAPAEWAELYHAYQQSTAGQK